jgi:hypothetical protein
MPMTLIRKIMLVPALLILLGACGNKKKPSLAGDDPVDVADFIEFFPQIKTGFTVNDELLNKKENDSLLISYSVFHQFVPDSIVANVFGKEKKLKIYPLANIKGPDGESYLFTRISNTAKKAVFVIVFDKASKFMTSMIALRSDASKNMQRSTTLDKRFTLTRAQTRKNPDGSTSDGKDVYVLNNEARAFTLIMTDALDDKITELINPIDTMAKKGKMSADYSNGKMNLVSIRDGRKPDRLSFFIHFEKNNGECTGELKGEAMIKSPTLAEYRLGGDPCVLQFKFSSTSVTLSEVEGCGSHRGLRCSFDGSYTKKKQPKPPVVKPKKK